MHRTRSMAWFYRVGLLIEMAGPWLAMLGLAASLAPDYMRISSLPYPGVDFRVLYAAAVQFARGGSPYAVLTLPALYPQAGFAPVTNLYGHMPVYPPFTFALLWPVGFMPGAASLWGCLVVSALLMALAIRCLLMFAREDLALPLPLRLVLIGMCAASPLMGFALEIGNLSVIVAALCIIGICCVQKRAIWSSPVFALALLLKPHLAIWVLAATALGWGRAGRRVAWKALALSSGFCVLTAVWLVTEGRLGGIVGDYVRLLHSEQTAGSMSLSGLERLPVGAQITALASLLEFLGTSHIGAAIACVLVVAVLAGALIRVAQRNGWCILAADERLVFTGAWVCLGMLTTYHRAHDAIVLILLLPSLLRRLFEGSPTTERRQSRTERDFVVSLLAGLMILGLAVLNWDWGAGLPSNSNRLAVHLLIYRQGTLAMLLLAVVTVVACAYRGTKKTA